MSASRVALVACVIVLSFALFSHTQQVPTAPAGTFQLVPAQYSVATGGTGWEQHTVFLVDSKSGQVWEYLPASKSTDGKLRDAVLTRIKAAQP